MGRKKKESSITDTTPKKKEKKTSNLIDATFLDKTGKEVRVDSIVNQDECWFLKREGKWVLTHRAIKKIADVAGISKNYTVEESSIMPDIRNELEHIVRVTIKCLAKSVGSGCVHDIESTLTVTGEANKISAPHLGRSYLRKMAEKRAFDIAVLEHVGIYSTVFSEEESEKFEKVEIKTYTLQPGMKDFEDIAEYINKILNAKTINELVDVCTLILDNKNKLSEQQVKYLRELYQKEYAKKVNAF